MPRKKCEKNSPGRKNAKNKRNGKVMIWKTKCKFGKLTKRILKTTQQIHQKQKCFQTQTARPLRQKRTSKRFFKK